MRFNPASSAPHLHPASAWEAVAADPNASARKGDQGRLNGLVLHREKNGAVEVGIEHWMGETHSLEFADDQLCYFMRGRGRFCSNNGEMIEAGAGMAAHFKTGWRGELEIIEKLEASYMRCAGAAGETRVLADALNAALLKDWGVIPVMLKGSSRTAGILLSRDSNGRAESGLWICTPGLWRCEVTGDEFCHFIDGRCVYTHEGGEQIEIAPDTLVFFPKGWRGECEVQQTVRKIYMIR